MHLEICQQENACKVYPKAFHNMSNYAYNMLDPPSSPTQRGSLLVRAVFSFQVQGSLGRKLICTTHTIHRPRHTSHPNNVTLFGDNNIGQIAQSGAFVQLWYLTNKSNNGIAGQNGCHTDSNDIGRFFIRPTLDMPMQPV